MATKITSGSIFSAGAVVTGVDADAPPAVPSPSPEPAPEPTPSANWVVVGVPYSDIDFTNSGSVYVYDINNLSDQSTKLILSGNGRFNDQFGSSVGATADKIFVGTPHDDDNGSDSGAVYVYDANDLSAQPTKLTAFDAAASDRFGKRLSANNGKLVVAAESDDDNAAENSGSVYVYDTNDLTAQPTKLTAFDGATSDAFGTSVDATSDKIVVGSLNDDDNGSNSGSAYVYDANDLSAAPTKLTAFDGVQGDNFGISVVATDDKIIVGAHYDDDNGSNSGSVYVYDSNDLSATPTKLTAFDGAAGDNFGKSVAAIDDKIFVGSPNFGPEDSGSVYVYDANDLSTQPTKLTLPTGLFGMSIDALLDKLIVGAPGDDGYTGSIYIYDTNDLSAQPTKLVPFDSISPDWVGYSVSIG
jgi:N-acetylneuraminic acid mutarotase